MPAAASRAVLACELETAPRGRLGRRASASMKRLTVEPVPIPMTASSATSSRAAAAARLFFASPSAVMHSPRAFVERQKRLCPPLRAGTVGLIRLGGHLRDRRVKAYFFLLAFFLAFFFAFAMLALQV